MVNFKDVGRNIEANAVASVFHQLPLQMALAQSLARSGGPQNLTTSNRNPEDGADPGAATGLGSGRWLRADDVPIDRGVLGP